MNEFNHILKEINEKLNVPHPGKSRIILEIANDIEGFYDQTC